MNQQGRWRRRYRWRARGGWLEGGGPTPDALLTEADEEITTEDGDVIIHEDTEP
ncbi:hypothetical protein LCGC14_2007020 [marine sediment metagenome]|uniref:Uncharacterized protein n=1 Tax=marine sediment metagenome TaxID=412755 RepID=A0A0F9F1D4_9ZZZZ